MSKDQWEHFSIEELKVLEGALRSRRHDLRNSLNKDESSEYDHVERMYQEVNTELDARYVLPDYSVLSDDELEAVNTDNEAKTQMSLVAFLDHWDAGELRGVLWARDWWWLIAEIGRRHLKRKRREQMEVK